MVTNTSKSSACEGIEAALIDSCACGGCQVHPEASSAFYVAHSASYDVRFTLCEHHFWCIIPSTPHSGHPENDGSATATSAIISGSITATGGLRFTAEGLRTGFTAAWACRERS